MSAEQQYWWRKNIDPFFPHAPEFTQTPSHYVYRFHQTQLDRTGGKKLIGKVSDHGFLQADPPRISPLTGRWEGFPVRLMTIDNVAIPGEREKRLLANAMSGTFEWLQECGFDLPIIPNTIVTIFPEYYQEPAYGSYSGGTVELVHDKYVVVTTGGLKEENLATIGHELAHAIILEYLRDDLFGRQVIHLGSNDAHPFLDEGLATCISGYLKYGFSCLEKGWQPTGISDFVNHPTSPHRIFSQFKIGIIETVESMKRRGFSEKYLNWLKAINACAMGNTDFDFNNFVADTNFRLKAKGKPEVDIGFMDQDSTILMAYSGGSATILELAQSSGRLSWVRQLLSKMQEEYLANQDGQVDIIGRIKELKEFKDLDVGLFGQRVCRRLVEATAFGAKKAMVVDPETYLDRFIRLYERCIEGELTLEEAVKYQDPSSPGNIFLTMDEIRQRQSSTQERFFIRSGAANVLGTIYPVDWE